MDSHYIVHISSLLIDTIIWGCCVSRRRSFPMDQSNNCIKQRNINVIRNFSFNNFVNDNVSYCWNKINISKQISCLRQKTISKFLKIIRDINYNWISGCLCNFRNVWRCYKNWSVNFNFNNSIVKFCRVYSFTFRLSFKKWLWIRKWYFLVYCNKYQLKYIMEMIQSNHYQQWECCLI